MDKKDLKNVIKHYVRESLTEIFAEMHLEKLIENSVKKHGNFNLSERDSTEARIVNESRLQESVPAVNKKRKLRELLNDDNMWQNVYGDIDESNPITSNAPVSQMDGREHVSENVLRESGLFKDYSKFVK